MAQLKRTGGADFPTHMKALITGPPKSGKTTLLGTIPDIVILDTEPKANNLASLAHLDVPYVTIERMADLREMAMILGNQSMREEAAKSLGMAQIGAVAIDTLDTMQKIMKRERLESERRTQFQRDDWGWMKEEMQKIIEAFTALPMHVIFTVHMKVQDVGTEKNPAQKILPGLEGAIAADIAGMVGYSLRSFRKEEFDAVTGNRFTKYWLQAEGDETYDFLGTRVGGATKLPPYIEPDFGTIYSAIMANRPTAQHPVIQSPQVPGISAPVVQGQVVPPQQAAPQAQAPATPAPETPPAAGPDPGPAPQVAQAVPTEAPAPAQPVAQPAPTAAPTTPPAGAAAPAPDDSPVSEGAINGMRKVYDALELAFPEAKLRTITLGEARTLVRMWNAVQQDEAEGKTPQGKTAKSEMVEYLTSMQYLPDATTPVAEPEKQIEAKLGGTIAEAKAWVGDGSDLAKVNAAFEHERTGGNRKSLMEWLESKGATHGGAAPAQPAVAGQAPGAEAQALAAQTPEPTPQAPIQPPVGQPAAQVQTPVQTEAPAPVQPAAPQGVTPEAPQADAPVTEEQATEEVRTQLGGVVIADEVSPEAKCEACGGELNDADIAKLAKTRFGKLLCVNDYIAATRA